MDHWFKSSGERISVIWAITIVVMVFLIMNPMTIPHRHGFPIFLSKQPVRAKAHTYHHYIANQGSLTADQQAALSIGLDWQDFSSDGVMNATPAGVRGVRWVGNGYNSACSWAQDDAAVTTIVNNNLNNPKFSKIYFISDEPHISLCPEAPTKLAERTALIHSLDPNAKTFAVILDGSNNPGEHQAFKDAVDYIGVDPYPCNNTNMSSCNLSSMTALIDNALTYVPANRIVPVFQVFGQECMTDPNPYYRLPTVAELQSMLAIWDQKVPRDVRLFDYSYGWRNQTNACPTFKDADGAGAYPDLQSVMRNYFTG